MAFIGIVVFVAMVAAGVALVVVGVGWGSKKRSGMARALAALVVLVGVAFIITLGVALFTRSQPWTPMLVLAIVAAVLAAVIFWVSVLADCLLNEPNDGMGKLVWVLAIVLTFVIGAAIYHLGRRPRRIQEQGR